MLNSTNIYACNQNRFTVSQLLSQQHEGRGEKKTSTAANSHLNKWNSKLWQCKNDLRTLRDINRNMVEKLSGESKSCSTHSKFGKYLHFTGIKYRYTKRSSWVPGSAGWDTILPSWTALSVLKHFPNTLLTFDTENVLKWLCVKRRYFLHKGALLDGWTLVSSTLSAGWKAPIVPCTDRVSPVSGRRWQGYFPLPCPQWTASFPARHEETSSSSLHHCQCHWQQRMTKNQRPVHPDQRQSERAI